MFIAPGRLLDCWRSFSSELTGRREALSRLAARDCIESVIRLRHPSVDRFAAAVYVVDERQRRGLRDASTISSRWWWSAAPPPPVEAPDLGSAAATATAAEIWRQASAAGLAPFDHLTFSLSGGRDVLGRLRFQVVSAEQMVVRPWIDFLLIPVERAYCRLIGADPPELFTATVSVAVGRLRDVGIHLPGHAGPEAVAISIARHIDSFVDIVSHVTPDLLINDLLRQRRFSGGEHFEWRLPLALVSYGRGHEALQLIEELMLGFARQPYSRSFHELQWLRRRLADSESTFNCPELQG
ncbi:hypothetical protein [Micromonospora aurantiaca (nom. illeg.)]|uniref:hypothetical protein n=1 Tax=Micromonospora aurantiaca (nom. illeg.) TaxID=47850 RepID=UPI003F49F2F4